MYPTPPRGLPPHHSRSETRLGDVAVHALHTGSGPDMVLVHGLCGSHRWWRANLPHLARHYRVHVPELVGFGASRGAPRQPDIPEMAALLADWMDAVELTRPHLVGHSMGGQIAIHIAAEQPPDTIDRLVLVNPAGVPHELSRSSVARLATELVPPRNWGDPFFLPTLAADVLRTGPRVLLRAARHLLADDTRPLLPGIDRPTLVVYGARDPVIPAEHARLIADEIPHARLVVIQDAGHNAMLDRPGRFNRVLLDFLGEA